MHGNVAEWCSDWRGKNVLEKLSGGTDPVGPEGGKYRAFRGGSWWCSLDSCRSADRFISFGVPSRRSGNLGFRVARSQSATVAEQRQQGSQAEPAARKEKAPRRPFD